MGRDKRTATDATKKGRAWNKTFGDCHLCGEKLRFQGDWQD